uniref:DUF4913 domain-containing protein n=1 Tax=Macrostomum lignano TaxID=282301 RepID=A0A1I8FHE3_9PLAT
LAAPFSWKAGKQFNDERGLADPGHPCWLRHFLEGWDSFNDEPRSWPTPDIRDRRCPWPMPMQ